MDAADENGGTAFHYACCYGRLDCAQLLVAAGCDMHKADDEDQTGRTLAEAEGHDELTKRLFPRAGGAVVAMNRMRPPRPRNPAAQAAALSAQECRPPGNQQAVAECDPETPGCVQCLCCMRAQRQPSRADTYRAGGVEGA